MIRRAAVLGGLVLGPLPAAAATTELNVIPHGQQEPGIAWRTAKSAELLAADDPSFIAACSTRTVRPASSR